MPETDARLQALPANGDDSFSAIALFGPSDAAFDCDAYSMKNRVELA